MESTLKIAEMRFGQEDCSITAKVEMKSEIKQIKGKLFNMVLYTNSGRVDATIYTNECIIYDEIELNRKYIISNFYLKPIYEIQLNHKTEVELVTENYDILEGPLKKNLEEKRIIAKVLWKSAIEQTPVPSFEMTLLVGQQKICASVSTNKVNDFYNVFEIDESFLISEFNLRKRKEIAFTQGTKVKPYDDVIFDVSTLKDNVMIAEVSWKSGIIPFESILFYMVLVDSSGEIGATAHFRECHKFYNRIQQGHFYNFSKFYLKPVNKKYYSLKNDFEIIFSDVTSVEPYEGKSQSFLNSIELKYNITNISEIAKLEDGDIIDTIGICTNVGVLETFPSGRERRYVVLSDQNNAEVNLTLWGNNAQQFKEKIGTIIFLQRARVNDYGGNEIILNPTSIMKLDPDYE